MIRLQDIRDLIAQFSIAEDEHCYCGKLDSKKEHSIGVYNLNGSRQRTIPIGGAENASYGTKGISLLVHWNRSPAKTEEAAIQLHKELEQVKRVIVNERCILWIQTMHEEPISVGTDEQGFFEYVIECMIYYEKEAEA